MTKKDDTSESEQSEMSVLNPSAKPKRNIYAVVSSLMASFSSILLGYDIGVMSRAIGYIVKEIRMTDVQREVCMGIINLISLVGSFIAGRISDWIGRRYTLIIVGSIFFVGALLMGFATNYAFLMSGRVVAGIGVGFGMTIAPVYTTEVAPPSARGFLTTFPEVFLNVGILLGYLSNVAFSKLPHNIGWRFMLGVGVIPAISIIVGSLIMPESPRWLVMQGRIGDARRVLDKISNSPEESESRLHNIMEAAGIPQPCNDEVVSVPKQNQGVWRDLVFPTPAVRHVLMCAFGIHLFRQGSGIDSIMLYSPTIFEKAGIKGERNTMLVMIAFVITKTIFIMVATFFVDKRGRRPLLLTSMAGCAFSLMGLGTGLTIIGNSDHPPVLAVVLSIASVLFYVSFFSSGMGPVVWIYCSEIFPLKPRAQGVSIGVALNRIISGIIGISFISLYKAITIGGTFFLYGGIAFLGWVYIYTLLPETRGRGLEEMEVLFGTFFKWRSTLKELNEKSKKENKKDVEA